MGFLSGLNDTKGIMSTIFVSLICFAYCVNWPLFQNAAERFSFLRKCELNTWKKHRIDIVLTVCWVSFVIKKTGIEICFSVIQHQLIFLNKHSNKPHIFFCVGSLRIHTDPALPMTF